MKKQASKTAIGLSFAALLGLAATQAQASDLSYTYLEGSYFDIDIDDSNADGDGFGVAGSAALSDLFHLFGNAATADLDGPGGGDVDFDTWEVGGGINFGIAPSVDLIGRASYINAEVDFPGPGSADDDGFGLYGGLRGRLGAPVELEGGVHYTDLDQAGDDTTLLLAGRYFLSDSWALGLSGDIGDDVTVWGLKLRWQAPVGK